MKNTQDNHEYREMSAKELSLFIVMYRKQKRWTQEILAELAKLSVRTVQRAENGESAGPDVRRALARAFELEDIDIFNKRVRIPDEKAFKKDFARMQQETLTLPLEKISSGKVLREMTEQAEAYTFDSIINITKEAEKFFAELQDYLKEYKDIYEELSAVQKLDINDDLQQMINKLENEDACLGIAVGDLRAGQEDNPLVFRINYYVIGKKDSFPREVKVKK